MRAKPGKPYVLWLEKQPKDGGGKMKCVCGYDGEDFSQFQFVDLGKVEPTMQFAPSPLVIVYACPKCGTLKINAEEKK